MKSHESFGLWDWKTKEINQDTRFRGFKSFTWTRGVSNRVVYTRELKLSAQYCAGILEQWGGGGLVTEYGE